MGPGKAGFTHGWILSGKGLILRPSISVSISYRKGQLVKKKLSFILAELEVWYLMGCTMTLFCLTLPFIQGWPDLEVFCEIVYVHQDNDMV